MQALYRKWRPQLWDEVVGQAHVVQTLRNALRSDRVAHAYLFSGPRGCGKTTTARLVAKALNCLHPDPAQRPDNTCAHCLAVNAGRFLDLIEIDGASNNSVENVRDLRDKINFAPAEGRYKIYLIDEVHMLSLGAFNALLKTLEEPPAHAVFILATTESYKIPPTVTSRCQRFEFRRIPVAEIVACLKPLCAAEGLVVEEAALEVVARQATGSLRDAISLLDQLVAGEAAVTLVQAQTLLGTAAGQTVQNLVEHLSTNATAAALDLIQQAVDAGADPRQLARQMVDYLRSLMLARLGNSALLEVPAEVREIMLRQAGRLETPAWLRAIRIFNAAANDVRGGWQPQLPLELAIVEWATPATATVAAPVPEAVAPPARALSVSPAAVTSVPAAAVPAPSTVAPPAPQPSVDLKVTWQRVLSLMRERDKLTEAALRSCTVLGLEGNTLKLSTQAKLVCQKINDQPQTRQLVTELLAEVLGFACEVKCQLVAGGRGGGRGSGHKDIPSEGMVATAVRDLGGEIVE